MIFRNRSHNRVHSGGKARIMPLIMPLPLLTSLLGIAFCAWIAFGNSAEMCVSAGCSLSSEMNIAGMSLWWFGCIGFSFLSVFSFSGRPCLGLFAATICLLADAALLLLMLVTAPCTSCLVVAIFFALTYVTFRRECVRNMDRKARRISWFLLLWTVLFIANGGAVLRESFAPWSMFGAEKPAISLYFSPSCTHCRQAVHSLSGNVQVAFYPVAEKPEDTNTLVHMQNFLAQGESMASALEKALQQTASMPEGADLGMIEAIVLDFRLQRNKSHLFLAGSSVVPYIEYRGLPSFYVDQGSASAPSAPSVQSTPYVPAEYGGMSSINTPHNSAAGFGDTRLDSALPIDMGIAGSCGGDDATGAEPCP